MNTINIITEEGVISNHIEIEFNGESQTMKNCDANWKRLFALSTYSINTFFQKHIDWDNNETITPWEQAPTFTARKRLFGLA